MTLTLHSIRNSLLVGGLLTTACGNWPNFDYAPSETRYVSESTTEDVLDLGVIRGNVLAVGNIDQGMMVEDGENPYELTFWYSGDMDWFAFSVAQPLSCSIVLDWESDTDDLDLLFLSASTETGVVETLLQYDAHHGPGPNRLETEVLQPEAIYVLAVGGQDAQNTSYDLNVLLNH